MKITKEYLKGLYNRYEALKDEFDELADACDAYTREKYGRVTHIELDINPLTSSINKEHIFIKTSEGRVPFDALASGDPARYARDETAKAKERAERASAEHQKLLKERRKQEYLKLKEEFENEAKE